MQDNGAERSEQLDLLKQALEQQRRSVRCFELLLNVAGRDEKKVLSAMQREDRRHYYLLEGVYEEISGQAYRPPRLSIAMPRQYIPMLQTMIKNKLYAISLYEKLDSSLNCVKQKELLAIVISDQKEQSRLLAEIYNSNI